MASVNLTDISKAQISNFNSVNNNKDNKKDPREDFGAILAGGAQLNQPMAAISEPGLSSDKDSGVSDISNIADASNVNKSSYNTVENRVSKNESDTDSDTLLVDEDKVFEKVDKFINDVKAELKEKLQVSDEEIEAAMETLGLSFMDLAEPKNLASLIGNLSGEEDPVGLLINDSFKDIMNDVSVFTTDLTEETGINLENLQEMVVENDEGFELVIPQAEPEINEQVQVSQTETNANINTSTNTNVNTDTAAPEAVNQMVAEEKTEPEVSVQSEVRAQRPVTENIGKVVETDAPKESEEPVEEAVETLKNIVSETANKTQSQGQSQNQGNLAGQGQNPAEQTPTGTVNENAIVAGEARFSDNVQTLNETPQVTTYTNINTQDIIEQVVTAARTNITEQVRSMELELNPQNLGRMLMRVTEADGQITARFFTQNEAVKAAMETAVATLMEKLEQQGIKVDAVEVSVGTHEFEQNLEQNFQDQARENLAEAAQNSQDNRPRRGGINLGDPAMMAEAELTEEEQLEADIMRTYGNTVNFRA